MQGSIINIRTCSVSRNVVNPLLMFERSAKLPPVLLVIQVEVLCAGLNTNTLNTCNSFKGAFTSKVRVGSETGN